MIKKVITGALILVILGASQTTGYAAYQFPTYKFIRNLDQSVIEINEPQGDVVVQDKLLISVRVLDDSSVSFNIYKVDSEKLEDQLIFGPATVDPKVKIYADVVKNVSPGKYKMVFDVKDKLGNPKSPVIRYFTVKPKEDVTKSLESIKTLKIFENLIDLIKN